MGASNSRVGDTFAVTADDGADSGPVPAAVRAATVKVYVVVGTRPVTVLVVAGPKVWAACGTPATYGVIR